jgi:hypothetical protein|tara:strand:- start:1498 stop:4731 length:3234 start_codon:yes stop_codon:yes gene_type:complete
MTVLLLGKEGKRKAIFLVLCMLLALTPISNVNAEDIGDPASLQAQDISAVFDPVSETTTVTWRNIDIDSSILTGLFTATYNVYRSDQPITPATINSLTPFVTNITACSSFEVGNDPFKCRGINGTVADHSTSFLVSPGENQSFYYGITTILGDGTEVFDLDTNASTLGSPVLEQTTPIRTPYNIASSYDPETSQTTVQWINYNDIFPILPESGDNAYRIQLYRTSSPVSRSNTSMLSNFQTVSWELPAGTSQYVIDIPENTDREAYYSVNYLLPNWTDGTTDYEDIRFLSNNAMTSPVREDNMPPAPVNLYTASFSPSIYNGRGTTTISWLDAPGEDGESYRVYMSDSPFSDILRSDVQLIATVDEDKEQFDYEVPIGRLGYAYYCVVIVDVFGTYDVNTSEISCSDGILEDAFSPWIAEPTNVHAEFIGNKTTRVTWTDQLGVEGEIYHVWKAGWRVTAGEWANFNESLEWLGSVSDGVGYFDVQLEEGLVSSRPYYFVTTEALYGHLSETYMYKNLTQNMFQIAEGNEEDTTYPSRASMKEVKSIGYLNKVTIEWFNSNEINEVYQVWRHYGEPFGEDESEISSIEDEGWEIAIDNIAAGTSTENTFFRQVDIPDNVDREVWYSVIVADQWGNSDLETYSGFGSNAIKVTEDTKSPEATISLINDNNEAFTSPSLIAGDYKVQIEFDEYLDISPMLNITTIGGGDILGGEKEMALIQENVGNPDRGPVYQLDFFITAATPPGTLKFEVSMEDLANNKAVQSWSDRAVDAVPPEVVIYSPSSSEDANSKYLYGNKIQLLSGALDDVRIDSFQYKFTYNYGTSESISTPWTEATEVTNLEGDNSSLVLDIEFTAGNFLPGEHAVFVRAIDSAGNERSTYVIFVVDECRNRLDGTTSCNYVESLKPEPEPVIVNPSMTDPPYILVWILSGIFILSVIVMIMVIQSSMSGPKKKKDSDEEGEDEDWMSEFIGTSQELDMAAVTDTSEKKDEKSAEPEEDDDEDPFAVNTVERKTRPKKDVPKIEQDSDDDDDGIDWGAYDDEDEDEEEKPVAKKRSVGRRAAPRKAPKRRTVGRKKGND